MTETPKPVSKLDELLNRQRYLPQPTREELLGAALLELHLKLAPFRRPTTKPTS